MLKIDNLENSTASKSLNHWNYLFFDRTYSFGIE
jgi:hypothetical protein